MSTHPSEAPLSLVTGASGFVGSHVARLLAAQGTPVRVLARPSSDLRAIKTLRADIASGDLRDLASLRSALRGVNTIYHVAADYRLWSRDPQEIYRSNLDGTRNLLRAARETAVERFVYTSTVGTIAVPVVVGFPDEATDATADQMIGHYKRSKFFAEQEVLHAARTGQAVVIVNPTTPVGPGDWKPTPTGKLILDFLNGRTPAYVDTGLNIVAVEDVARGHLLAAERGRSGERYLLGGKNMTLKEILGVLAASTGGRPPRWKIPHAVALAAGYVDAGISAALGREPRIPLEGVRMARHTMWVDSSKAARELGFAPRPPEEALRRAAAWYLENGYVRVRRRVAVSLRLL
ncbi:MAG: hopanoid-associated sugar epimerase [Terriglobia bacterium]